MLVVVMCVRNEAEQLPGFLAHVRDHVDGFVAVDDGSTDATSAILKREPKLLGLVRREPRAAADLTWDEPRNRQDALLRAKEEGATWILALDPDMRLERRFLDALPGLRAQAEEAGRPVVGVWLRELWNHPRAYRVDGIWGLKSRAILFALPEQMTFDNHRPLHGPWVPSELAGVQNLRIRSYNLYHLGSMRAEWRVARRDKYRLLDPEEKLTSVGYDYLADEEDLELAAIDGREYALDTMPPSLAPLLGAAVPTRIITPDVQRTWRLLEELYAAFSCRDSASLEGVLAEDVRATFDDSLGPAVVHGRDAALARFVARLRSAPELARAHATLTWQEAGPTLCFRDGATRCLFVRILADDVRGIRELDVRALTHADNVGPLAVT